jgi:valyl-tRNA synthetase
MVQQWPEPIATDEEAERDFDLVMEIIRQIRNARAEAVRDAPDNIKRDMTSRRIEALIAGGPRTAILRGEAETIARLARLDPAKLDIEETLPAEKRPEKAATLVIGEAEVVLPLAGLVDLDSERKRLISEAEQAQAEIARTDELLANEGFTSRAPAQVVDRERAKLAAARDRLARLNERIAAL